MKEIKIHEWIFHRKVESPKATYLRMPKELVNQLKKGNYLIKIYKLESEDNNV